MENRKEEIRWEYQFRSSHTNVEKGNRKWRERNFQRSDTRKFTRTKRAVFTDQKSPWVLSTRKEEVLNESYIIVKFQHAEAKDKFLKASYGGGEIQVTYKRPASKMA